MYAVLASGVMLIGVIARKRNVSHVPAVKQYGNAWCASSKAVHAAKKMIVNARAAIATASTNVFAFVVSATATVATAMVVTATVMVVIVIVMVATASVTAAKCIQRLM